MVECSLRRAAVELKVICICSTDDVARTGYLHWGSLIMRCVYKICVGCCLVLRVCACVNLVDMENDCRCFEFICDHGLWRCIDGGIRGTTRRDGMGTEGSTRSMGGGTGAHG